MKSLKSQRKKIGSFLLTSIVATGLLAGCNMGQDPGQRADRAVKMVSRKLDLDEAQRAKLEEVKKAMLESRERNRAATGADFAEIKAMILSERLDITKAKALMDKKHAQMQQELEGVFAKVSDFHATLRPEQKQEAVEALEKFHSHMGHH